MKLSILVPNYNYATYIADAIDSTSQFPSDTCEVLVQDGNSTDQSVAVVAACGPGRENVHCVSEPDRGQSDALNRAFRRSRGEWIGWLNSDEFYLPGVMGSLAQILDDESVDIIYGDCYFVDANGRAIRLLPAHKFDRRVLVNYGCFIPSCATFIRRRVIEELGWNCDLRRSMDWDLWLRASRRFSFHYINRPLSAFRVHEAQVTATPEKADAAEFASLAAEHELPSRAGISLARLTGRLLHVGRKASEGAYTRQWRANRSLNDVDLRWWKDGSVTAVAEVATRI